MTLTLLLCLLFFFGYLALRSHPQALAFLAVGAGLQLMSHAFPRPEDAADPDRATLILVCLFSGLGYVAWRTTRRWLKTAPYGRQRVLVFLGWGVNGVIFTLLLWQTGTLSLPG